MPPPSSIDEMKIPRKDRFGSFHCSSWCCAYILLLHLYIYNLFV